MENNPYIPPRTADKLATEFGPGSRHAAAVDIAMSLIGNGLPDAAVFATLRSKFPAEKTDRELQDIIAWVRQKHPTPSGFSHVPTAWRPAISRPPAQPKPKPPAEHAAWWLSGQELTIEQFKEKSQLPVPAGRRDALQFALEMLWLGTDNLNIVCAFIEDGGKSKPHGPGRIVSRDKWVEYIQGKGVPDSRAGAWIRPNPCKPQGSGAAGAVTDSDITAWKYLLVESDVLPIGQQLALFSRLKLPIAAVVMSGGVSAHAWVYVGADTPEKFTESARRILTALVPFGIDQANKNPSRLSRLPCARRVIGAAGDGEQSLLWLNPGVPALTTAALECFEDSLCLPAIEDKPFRRVIEDAIPRYEWLRANQGKLGVRIGFPTLDSVMGGWKPATMTVITAETGHGKSTIALNMINAAVKSGVGVVLFTLEMTRDDICDMLFSINAKVDRNLFNTGAFEDQDVEAMAKQALWLKSIPLWLEDSASITIESIRKHVLALKADNRIGLVVVDYAQLVDPSDSRDSREQQVAKIARGLRCLSKDAMLPIIVLSQLNDEGKVRESRVLGHEAANIMRLELKKESGKMTLFIDKGRKIPSHPIHLYFDATHCLIAEAAKIDRDDVNRHSSTPYKDE